MRTGIRLFAFIALLVTPAFAQDATVTFYAPGSATKTVLKEMLLSKAMLHLLDLSLMEITDSLVLHRIIL
jgi:hypothetical protein